MKPRVVESTVVRDIRFVKSPLTGKRKLEMLVEERYTCSDYTGGGFITEWREVPTVWKEKNEN